MLAIDAQKEIYACLVSSFLKVSPDGRFVSHSHAKKPSYGTMLWVRSVMVTNQGRQLSRAATIAIRYSAVRQQGRIDTKYVYLCTRPTRVMFLTPHPCHVSRTSYTWRLCPATSTILVTLSMLKAHCDSFCFGVTGTHVLRALYMYYFKYM